MKFEIRREQDKTLIEILMEDGKKKTMTVDEFKEFAESHEVTEDEKKEVEVELSDFNKKLMTALKYDPKGKGK